MKIQHKYTHNLSNLIGGGNFAQADLTPSQHLKLRFFIGRLSPFAKTVAVALFAFMAVGGVSSCSGSDGEAETVADAVPDYSKVLPRHEWRLADARHSTGSYTVQVSTSDVFFRFSADSLYCTQQQEVNYFDQDGHITYTDYEQTLLGRYPYYIKGDQLQLDTQTLRITENIQGTDTTFLLKNEKWQLVLKNK